MIDAKGNTIEIGDVVQIDPECDDYFGGCFMVVTELITEGAQGYIEIPGSRVAYYRCGSDAMYKVGHVEWKLERIDDHSVS